MVLEDPFLIFICSLIFYPSPIFLPVHIRFLPIQMTGGRVSLYIKLSSTALCGYSMQMLVTIISLQLSCPSGSAFIANSSLIVGTSADIHVSAHRHFTIQTFSTSVSTRTQVSANTCQQTGMSYFLVLSGYEAQRVGHWTGYVCIAVNYR